MGGLLLEALTRSRGDYERAAEWLWAGADLARVIMAHYASPRIGQVCEPAR